ncbi:MAG: hypothetical protein HQK83_18775 [Fibrobacteria bacterium]|nr:hypothetical protein [Fibrobacteria bacterium]
MMKMNSIKLVSVITCLLITSCSYNIGHRLGGSIDDSIPENTIASLEHLLQTKKSSFRFLYIELDVRESKDSVLYVFHDEDLERMVPLEKYGNKELLNDFVTINNGAIMFNDLESGVINQINLSSDSITIPRLQDVLSFINTKKINKKVYIEIKDLRSEKARTRLRELIRLYKDHQEIHLLAFKRNFISSFPEPRKWCNEFSENGVRVLTIGWHRDLCKKFE